MKLSLIIMLALGAASATGQTLDARVACNEAELPASICSQLDAAYGSWSPAYPAQNVVAVMGRFHSATRRSLVVVEGDFDGNGHRDYAVHLLTCAGDGECRKLVAFLNKDGEFVAVPLDAGRADGQYYIRLAARGTKDYDYTNDKDLVYEHDAIGLSYFEKGGSSFIFKDGKFMRLISSD